MKTIEYIGPKPQKKRSSKGNWWMLFIALTLATISSIPLLKVAQAQNAKVSSTTTSTAISTLENNPDFSHQLAAAALRRTQLQGITLDHTYYTIDYPGGDLPANRGKDADFIIRSFRALEIDLQVLVHEDMTQNFQAYPQIFNMEKPDPNIDHRRVLNLNTFFNRHGDSKKLSRQSEDYAIGDLVIWKLPYGAHHMGIVVPGPGTRQNEKWVAHFSSKGPVWENALFSYEIIGHYSYSAAH